jgi:hypothetical protein
MKTFFHSLKFAALTLSIFFTTSASAGLKSNATCINYNGEDILQFELEEVEIVASRLPLNSITGSNSATNISEIVYLIDLPEVVINENITDINKPVTLINEEKIKDTAEPISKPVMSTKDLLQPEIKGSAHFNEEPISELKKRPFLSFIANKAYHAGIQFLKSINEGLFFKS